MIHHDATETKKMDQPGLSCILGENWPNLSVEWVEDDCWEGVGVERVMK